MSGEHLPSDTSADENASVKHFSDVRPPESDQSPRSRARWSNGNRGASPADDIPRDDIPRDDILASIRRVLNEDNAPAGLGRGLTSPSSGSGDAASIPASGDEGGGRPAATTSDLDGAWVWEERQRLFEQIARLEQKVSMLAMVAAICASTLLGVLAGLFLGVEAGAAVYVLSCVITILSFRFAFRRDTSPPLYRPHG